MNYWQPIETAPRDGTEIDVWEYCHDPAWRPESHGIASGMRCTNVRWQNDQWEVFFQHDGEWDALSNDHYTVSHWIPIPRPPCTDGDQR